MLTTSLFSQVANEKFENSDIKCLYTTQNGNLDGQYTCWYPNGEKKSEGTFSDNNRMGKWKVWDNAGTLLVCRNYKNNYSYEQSIPEISPEENKVKFDSKRNSAGLYEYLDLKEDQVGYTSRSIGVLLPKDNPEMFSSKKLLKMFFDNKDLGEFTTFEVTKAYEQGSIGITSVDNSKLLGLKTRIEYVFDNVRLIMVPRIVFISPVILDTKTNVISDQNWMFFNRLLPYLADVKIENSNENFDVKNVADLFYWHLYPETIFMTVDGVPPAMVNSEAFVNDAKMKEMLSDSEEIMLQKIEKEHDLWIKFSTGE
jgi:hypothetical protein